MNSYIYEFVGFVLQASQAHNITVGGGAKYNVPSENITVDWSTSESASAQNLTSYALAAISGADDFNDDNTTTKDVFDFIVNTTREVTPTCKLSSFAHICPFHLHDPN